MQFKMLVAAIAVLTIAVPVSAGDNDWVGNLRPAYGASFNGGLTEFNNSIGMSVGSNVSLFRFGPVRFPTVGAELGGLYKCPANGITGPAGPDGECRMTGAVLVSGGADFVIGRERASDGVVTGEKAISVALTRVVVGPLRDSWGVRVGMAFRFRNAH